MSKLIDVQCQGCQKNLKRYAKHIASKIFCSIACYRAIVKAKTKSVKCDTCSKQIDRYTKKGRKRFFCSQTCYRAARRPVVSKIFPCDMCGDDVNVKPYREKHNKHFYCSIACHALHRTTAQQITRNCNRCNKVYTAKPHENKYFCSMKCRRLPRMKKNCQFCRQQFTPRPKDVEKGHGIYCTRRCADMGKRIPAAWCAYCRAFIERPHKRKTRRKFCGWRCYLALCARNKRPMKCLYCEKESLVYKSKNYQRKKFCNRQCRKRFIMVYGSQDRRLTA